MGAARFAHKVGGISIALVALGLLVLAPGAQAAKGVYDAFGASGSKGGEFSSGAGGISGAAVNSGGAGTADPGDVYVLDRGQNRIQRYDEDGKFISAFGQDVVESGPGNNGSGFEICKAADGDVCKAGVPGGTGGALNFASSNALSGIAVNQTSGDVYVGDSLNRRIQQFSAAGSFIRAWGKDVVSSGPEDSAANEQQRVTVKATAGTFTLTFGGQTATAIPFNASEAVVEGKLNALSSIGGVGGSVTVSGGPGDATGTVPYLITFGGSLGGDNVAQMTSDASGLSGGSPSSVATMATTAPGGAFEVCETAANCKGSPASESSSGAFSQIFLNSLAVAPEDAPNEGNVLVGDGGNNRVQEFTSTGAFVRAFGWDVVASGPGNSGSGFEVCSAAALDICKDGTAGSGQGQFNSDAASPRIAEDSSGNLYTVENTPNFRVQKFTVTGATVSAGGPFDPTELSGTGAWNTPGKENTPIAVAVDTSAPTGTPGHVYVLKYFPQGSGSPPLEEKEARVLEVDPAGNGGAGKVIDEFMVGGEVGSGTASVNALALNSASGRLYVVEPPASVYVIDETVPPAVTPEATEAGGTSAVFHASITPAPLPNLHTFYRFEYSRAGTDEWKFAPAPPATDVDIGNGASPVAVSQTIEGLQVGTTYELRVLAYSKYKGAVALVDGDPFTTEAVPPTLSTGVGRWSSPASTKPSLTLNATINPGNSQTTFVFEYLSEEEFVAHGFNSPQSVPPLPAQAGHGTINTDVLWSIAGLDPAKTYRYRVAATNSAGTTIGGIRTVTPPNPSDRFYELVSNGESNGIGVNTIEGVSDDGERVVLMAQTIGDPNSLPAQRTPFISQRGTEGWDVKQVNPPSEALSGPFLDGGINWFPADLSTMLWSHYTAAEQIHGEVHWTFTDPDGAFRPALPTLVPLAGRGTPITFFKLTGGAADLSSFVFQRYDNSVSQEPMAFVPGQPLTTGEPGDIYRVSGAAGPSPTLTLVNYDQAGNLISNACGAWVGSNRFNSAEGSQQANKGLNLRPVSTDGKATYFSARPSGSTACNEATDRIRVFKRIEDSSTVAVSQSQCIRTMPTPCSSANGDDFFQAASNDGNRVFITTTRQLTDSDEDATLDLYLYDSNPPSGQPTLVQVSAGEVTANHPKVGSGAEVQEGVVDVSADGSRVYFVAKGQLTPAATKGASNLFVYQRDAAHPTGRIAFVAKLDGADSFLWGNNTKRALALPFYGPDGKAPGDGHFLLFSSKAKLLGADTDTATDLYRYDDESAGLICLTCQGNGNFDVDGGVHSGLEDPAGPQRSRIASEDLSSVAFATKESLSAADQNTVSDAYLWHEGTISLISPGNAGSDGLAGPPRLSPDGDAVYFLSPDRILPPDHNSASDVYSARIGGGFPEPEQTQSCISAAECRSAPTATPGTSSPASASFSGPGNQAQPASKCAKGKVKKKGRCVKKAAKHKKKRKHQRSNEKQRAHNDRGGKR